jgi:hypothetical protein
MSLQLKLQAALQRAEFAEQRYRYGLERWTARTERLRAYAEEHGFLNELCAILANGTTTSTAQYDPPTYERQLNILRHRAEDAEKRAADAEYKLLKLITGNQK